MTSEAMTRHSREARGERGIHAKLETSERRDAREGKKNKHIHSDTFDDTFHKPLTLITDITLPRFCHTFGLNLRHI